MSLPGEIQKGDCSSCGKEVAYKVYLDGTNVKVNAQHTEINLDCDKPFPKGQEITGEQDDTVYEPQVINLGILIAVPPGNDGFEPPNSWNELLTQLGFQSAGYYTVNELQHYQVPERQIPLENAPHGTVFVSISGPVRAKKEVRDGPVPDMPDGGT